MKLVNETADLVSRLTSVLDDSREVDEHSGILGINIDSSIAQVHMSKTLFFNNFAHKNYDVECNEHSEYPYQLQIDLDGIVFFAIMDAAEVVALKNTHSDHFDYISKMVQL